MKFVILLTLATFASCEDTRTILNSPQLLLQSFVKFTTDNSRHYTLGEAPLRLRLYKSTLQRIAAQNEADEGWISGVNFFADMTEEEKEHYLGLNISLHDNTEEERLGTTDILPDSVNWIEKGYVTQVKNQGSCGSCWSFGSVVSIEGVYKKEGGKLKDFAEQEYLDCVYTGRNGCRGGWHTACFKYSRDNQRLATTANYPYTARDADRGACDLSKIPNGLKIAKVTGYKVMSAGEEQHLQALTQGPTTVAFEVTNVFQIYQSGIMKDRTCNGAVNHAVAAVGYTEKYIIVKNSWGKAWGDEGFVKMGRGWGNCQLNNHVAYALAESLDGTIDTDPESPACDYDPELNPGPTPGPDPIPDPDCKDEFENWCRKSFCIKPIYHDTLCRKTCDNCWIQPTVQPDPQPTDDGTCPDGTVRCSDGVCRHEHMC